MRIGKLSYISWPPKIPVNISNNFTIQEAIKSNTAAKLGIDNWPYDQQLVDNIVFLAQQVVQPTRNFYGVPITPNSWFRSEKLNDAVGGATSSFHKLGLAVDLEVPNVSTLSLARWMADNVPYDTIILESYTPSIYNSGWVHVQICDEKRFDQNRQRLLTYVDGKYQEVEEF